MSLRCELRCCCAGEQGDGYDDVMVGAPEERQALGNVYVLLGKPQCAEEEEEEAHGAQEEEDGAAPNAAEL